MDMREQLNDVLRENTAIREVEPHIYSVQSEGSTAAYDKFGSIYEAVACNRFYNRLIWGYWPSEFHKLCTDVISSGEGWILDVGCGSMAFTAKTYLASRDRPVILSDQSIWMLRTAKKRITSLNGSMPDNMILLHADAMHLPIKDSSMPTVMAMNLLHAVRAAEGIISELSRVCVPGGALTITTLVKTGRFADACLHKLASGGAMVERDLRQLENIISGMNMTGCYLSKGNMAFVNLGMGLDFFGSVDCRRIAHQENH